MVILIKNHGAYYTAADCMSVCACTVNGMANQNCTIRQGISVVILLGQRQVSCMRLRLLDFVIASLNPMLVG
jgi:hypothetical protein